MALRPRNALERPRDTLAALLAAAVLLAMLTTFAIELASTQAHNRAGVRARVHDRAVLTGALVDGLFGTIASPQQYAAQYGGAMVSRALLARRLGQDTYLAVTRADGSVIAATPGLTASLAEALPRDAGVRFAQESARAGARGSVYGLGNAVATPHGQVVTFVVPFKARSGALRMLVTGFQPQLLEPLLGPDLTKVPGVSGAHNYVVDGAGVILASSVGSLPPGAHFRGPIPAGTERNFAHDVRGRYYDEVRLDNSLWRVALSSPDGPLYASVSGIDKWLPWIIFAAFAVVGVFAFYLVGRVFRAAAEMRQANARLATLNRELEESNTMLEERAQELARSNAELDQFASIASHDLQEPLRKVRTFTEQLARVESENLSPKGADYVRRANSAAERMQTLIVDLLRFSRVSTHVNPLAPVDLEQVVADARDDLSEAVEQAQAQIHVGDLPTIIAEPVQMRQLMQNLISNAIKFRSPDRPPEVWIGSAVRDGSLQLTVRDNGIGFEPGYAERIFRVFERLHGRTEYPGTGIGLALCRKIVERHGGTMTADATPGVGATFTIVLPLHRAGGSDAVVPVPQPAVPEEAHV